MTATVPSEEQQQPSFREALSQKNVRILAVSRGASKLAQATVSYGAMIFLAMQGASQFEISLVASSTYLAALLFGLQGGSLADSLSKRIAIIIGYVGQAAVCILVPILFGTDVLELMFIMFMSSALMQLITPSLKSAVALVTSEAQLATVAATVNVFGSIAAAIGSSLLAPILIKLTDDIKPLLFVSGGIYLLGAVRTLAMPMEAEASKLRQAVGEVDWRPTALSMRATANWIVNQRDVATMILMGGIVVALFEAFNTMIPVYIRDVLNADPVNAVYIFAPAAVGFFIGTFLSPKMMYKFGERDVALVATACMTISMIMFGAVELFAPILAPFSPLRLVGWLFDVEISDLVLAASIIAIPANFGSTAAGSAVQTYINRRVPLVSQGATFGLEEVQENALTLATIMTLGVISSIVGPQFVFIFAPIVVLGFVMWLIRHSFRTVGDQEITRADSLRTLVDSSGDEAPIPDKPKDLS